MKRHFLFTFKVLDGSGDNTYQCIVESVSGIMPDLNGLAGTVERRWKSRKLDLQYLCHSEFRDEKDLTDFLGKLYETGDKYDVNVRGIVKLKSKAE